MHKTASKKLPSNPKYQKVKPVVDSGFTVRKYLESIEELHRNFKYSKDEIFRRIKLDTFLRLVLEVWRNKSRSEDERIFNLERCTSASVASLELSESSIGSLTKAITPFTQDSMETSRSTLSGVIRGIGELDLCQNKFDPPIGTETVDDVPQPYLLLDVRNLDDFNQWHIKSAISYPHTMLSRVMNYEIKDLLMYKNKPGHIIVLYDEDETLSQKVATVFVQRGYDNIYLLSGGLNLAWKRFAHSLVTGLPPKSSLVVDGSSGMVQSSIDNLSGSLENEFTLDDLNHLEQHIDYALLASSSGSRTNPSTSRSKSGFSPSYDSRQDRLRSQQLLSSRKPWK